MKQQMGTPIAELGGAVRKFINAEDKGVPNSEIKNKCSDKYAECATYNVSVVLFCYAGRLNGKELSNFLSCVKMCALLYLICHILNDLFINVVHIPSL